ncbi:hypothetical protein DFP72DRAFT_481535 [Ephemerocybe angulata]|uniref:Uncharacterized protein n=1 Tax=Ephemerocybe angulata TaxID=980116 RepID=A0A8H6IDW7_9AGAR|nr:hypothetical protein DFP72DRAFT_481535 [Tulosesus angulatus]
MGIYLTLHFTIVYVAYYTFFFIDLTRTVFGPSPLPDQVPCYLAQRDVRTMVIPFFLLLFNITSACLLSICLVLLNYRHSKSPFIKILYIDGTYHFVLMAATTTGNAALWLAASYEYRFLLLAAHQVVHSTLASRILLRMREVAHKDLEPTLDGSSDMRLTRITFAHTGSTRSTMTSYSSSAGHADKLDNIN